MRLLLDENTPTMFVADFSPAHDVQTVRSMGWLGKKNGELLGLMTLDGFDALITIDKSLPRQHDLARLPLAIILLRVYDNRLPTLQALMPQLMARLQEPVLPGVIEIQ